jgi:hypothetical protein
MRRLALEVRRAGQWLAAVLDGPADCGQLASEARFASRAPLRRDALAW